MAAIHTWSVTRMDCLPSQGNRVIRVHWRLLSVDVMLSASTGGAIDFPITDDDIVPYADITMPMVIGWMNAAMGYRKAEIEAALAGEIEAMREPGAIILPLPW